MLNFEPHFGPQYWHGGHGFNKLESTLFEDVWNIILQIEAMQLFEKDFKTYFLHVTMLNFGIMGHSFNNVESTLAKKMRV